MLNAQNCGDKVCPVLTEREIDDIAEKAAEKAIRKLTDHVYQEVGKSVVSKFVYIVGALTLTLYLWAKSKGLVG